MNLLTRCLLFLAFIVLMNTTIVCAQSSFLDELRISKRPNAFDSLDKPQPPGSSASVDSDFSEPKTTSRPLRNESTLREHDPLFDQSQIDAEVQEEDWTGRSELQDVTALAGFESSCTPDFDACDIPLIRYRTTCYQGAQAAYGVIPASDTDGLGIRTLDLYGTFAVPLGSMDHVISFTPFFRMDQLNADPLLDVPDALYEVGVKSFWKKVINDRLTTMVLFTPSVRSDFQSNDGAFKLFGMALLQWKLVPDRLSMTGGAIYTGRADFPVLPTMGLYWTPSPLWKLDLQFPSPRISRRLLKDGDQSETWAYLSGVFGGNTWAVKRASGATDQLTLRDLRLVVGVEHLLRENRGVFVETGLVFNRSMEYENTPVPIDFGDAILLRAGIQF